MQKMVPMINCMILHCRSLTAHISAAKADMGYPPVGMSKLLFACVASDNSLDTCISSLTYNKLPADCDKKQAWLSCDPAGFGKFLSCETVALSSSAVKLYPYFPQL